MSYNSSTCEYETTSLHQNIGDALTMLTPDNPFVFVDLDLSDEEQWCLENLYITNKNPYMHSNWMFGCEVRQFMETDKVDMISSEIYTLIKSIGNDDKTSNCVTKIINKIITSVAAVSSEEMVDIRLIPEIFNPPQFQGPLHWHIDYGEDTPNPTDLNTNFVIALKGPQTLFFPASYEVRKEFNKLDIECNNYTQGGLVFEPYNDEVLINYSHAYQKIIHKQLAVSAKPGQAAIFLMYEAGAVHSAPTIDGERLFLSIRTMNPPEDLK